MLNIGEILIIPFCLLKTKYSFICIDGRAISGKTNLLKYITAECTDIYDNIYYNFNFNLNLADMEKTKTLIIIDDFNFSMNKNHNFEKLSYSYRHYNTSIVLAVNDLSTLYPRFRSNISIYCTFGLYNNMSSINRIYDSISQVQ